jgi:YidC/Oxa1 family membrane protein insertase
MSHEKRFFLFLLLMMVWLYTFPYVFDLLGIKPIKKPATPAAAATKEVKGKDAAKATAAELKAMDSKAKEEKPAAPEPSKVEVVPESELVLGSSTDKTPEGYRLEVHLEQKGAGISSLVSSRYDAEFKDGKKQRKPLMLIERDPLWPASLSMSLSPNAGKQTVPAADDDLVDAEAVEQAEDPLDRELWEVVRDDQKKIVRKVSKRDPATKADIEGQAIVFQTTAADGLVVTKTFRLWPKMDSVEVELSFQSPGKPRTVVYNLLGPHGIPIEGEWYTSTFREVFFGLLGKGGSVEIPTYSAADVSAAKKPLDNTALPLRFAGVENQYFATLVEPLPPPTGQENRWDELAVAMYHPPSRPQDRSATQKGAVAVKIKSRPIKLDTDAKAVHTYRVFAGPKTPDVLAPYGAEGLASYRKSSWIPFAPYLARVFITPTLSFTYDVTRRVAALFGGARGNYGIAIILLTFLVRLVLFPLGRKQALSAQKMQEIQPYLKEVQEKYKDDKERLTKETFALYKQHGFNPFGGCLPALVQIPIFVGLWQALNTSVVLRHASFLWIRDLAAPDMLFQFPGGTEVPFLGHWFNLLPIVVVSLMLVQTKLFSPPPTTPEAEMNQKMMKYMMVFMAVMFYKVPAGLGIYFITSSLWSIGERLLIPKLQKSKKGPGPDDLDGGTGLPATSPRGGKGAATPQSPAKPPGRFAQFWEKVLDEARKDPTYRKMVESTDPNRKDGNKGKDPGRDRDRDRDRGRPRSRPKR